MGVDTGVGDEDRVPGEVGTIVNTAPNHANLEDAENVVYLGKAKFFGQTPGQKIMSLSDWEWQVASWNNALAKLDGSRLRPNLGIVAEFPEKFAYNVW